MIWYVRQKITTKLVYPLALISVISINTCIFMPNALLAPLL